MRYVDPDRLVLVAHGDAVLDPTESGHLEHHARCRAEVDAAREFAGTPAA